MKISISKQVQLLGLSFLFLFTGFNGVQQYVTTFFSQIGLSSVGFHSLILIYLFFTLSDPFSAIFVSKYGAKKSMATGAVFYALFILILATKSLVLIYLASMILGIGASLLWTGQNSYLVRITNDENRGTNAGFFGTLLFLGSAIGVIAFGFLIAKFSYQWTFLFAALLAFLGFLLLLRLQDIRSEKPENHLLLLRKAIMSKTAWKLSTIWFSVYFAYGLAIGIIPIEIKKTMGISYVGSLSSLFYITPIFLTLGLGKLSDKKGRKGILLTSFVICILGLITLYFSHEAILLIIGILLIALYFSMVYPLTLALVGDVSTKSNLEYLTAFFWMIQNIGVVSSLLLSAFIQTKMIYVISIVALLITFFILIPLLKQNFITIKEKISKEIG